MVWQTCRGRPPGSKNKPKGPLGENGMSPDARVPKKRGRPKGSKNKPRGEHDAGVATGGLPTVASLPFPFNVSNPFMTAGAVPEAINHPAFVAALTASLATNPLTAAYANLAAALQTHQGMAIPQATSPPARKKGRPPGSKNKPKPIPGDSMATPDAGKEDPPEAVARVKVEGATAAPVPVEWPSAQLTLGAGGLQPTSIAHVLQSTSRDSFMQQGVSPVEDLGPHHDGFMAGVGEPMERNVPRGNGLVEEVGELMERREHEHGGLLHEVVGPLDVQVPHQDMMLQAPVEAVKPYQGEGDPLAPSLITLNPFCSGKGL